MTTGGFMTHHALMSPEQLALHLKEYVVVDCRHSLQDPAAGRRLYKEGHIPGAIFMHLDQDLSGPTTGSNGRHPLPTPETLAATLGAAGISRDSTVVAYDDMGGAFAARLWWLLCWMGHDDVAILNGGLPAWVAAGGALEVGENSPGAKPALEWGLTPNVTVDAQFVLAHLNNPTVRLVDARAADRFRGENETIDPVGGHIPGAINRFFKDNLGADGRFKPSQQLRQEFEALLQGLKPSALVSQCGSGVTACHNLLALEVAGLPGARLYPGSWSEWCSNPERPVAQG
jgi:thiosulfate/3-mercaptopyruvate sulfurtransferase